MNGNCDPQSFAFLRQHRIAGVKAVLGQLMLEDLGTQKIILLIFAIVPVAAGMSLAAAPGPERFAVVPLTLLSIVLVGLSMARLQSPVVAMRSPHLSW